LSCALGAAVAGVVAPLLDGHDAIRDRTVDVSIGHPVSGVSDDLGRLFERREIERSET
jgi:hypothetical protein